MRAAPIYGLVLAGGASKRMGVDKATLSYLGKSQLQRAFELLQPLVAKTFVSVRAEQRDEPTRAGLPQIVDAAEHAGLGPIAGIAAAQAQHPDVAWLILACDLPFASEAALRFLIEHRNAQHMATAYRSSHDDLPEPLCAIWEPASRAPVASWIAAGKQCPRKLLINSDALLLVQPDPQTLDNVNTPDEYRNAQQVLERAPIQVRAQYFAIFREQAGTARETIETRSRTAAELYQELRRRHGFRLEPTQLKVAINAEFRDWQTPLHNGDQIAFIPPVAGG